MNRLGLKISCLVVAIVIWVQVAATSDVERGTNFPLRVVGLSEGLTLEGSVIPDEVHVVLRTSRLMLLAHNYLNHYLGEVRLNLAEAEPGPAYSYELSDSDVYSDLLVLDVSGRIRLHVDSLRTLDVPIEMVTEGRLPGGVDLVEPLRLEPDSVRVSGAGRFFPDDPSVRTAPIALAKLTTDEDFRVHLVAPHHELRLERDEARVVFRLGVLEDRTMANIPVVPLVDSGRPAVGVSPPVADVLVRGVADSVRTLTESRFSITVAVGDRPEGVYQLPGHVVHPAWLKWARLDPPVFQVIVGNPPVDPLFDGTAGDNAGQGDFLD